MQDRERDILERAVASVAEQAAKADALIDELKAAGLPEDGPVLQAELIRLELLKVKGDPERARPVGPGLPAVQPAGPLGRGDRRPAGTLGACRVSARAG